jgi:phenylpropionate dioxygenase-like ring-hydroxylating dioxygenase large terminal subunit
MFVRHCWYVIAWDYEVPTGTLVARRIMDELIVLYRRSNGELTALEDRCVHRLAPLSKGRLEGDNLRCLYHGLKFAPNGRCVEIPGLDQPVPERARVRTYPVVEQDSWIWIWMGASEAADRNLIPSAVGLRHPRFVVRSGQLDYTANYMLINDNLTDLSHLSYVHEKSFGADLQWGTTRPEIERLERGIRVSRWLRDSPPIPPLGEAARHSNVDIWSSYDFLAPGVFLMYTGLYPSGTADRLRGAAPAQDLPSLHGNFTSQAVTPTSNTTSRYFFSWGPDRNQGDESMAQTMLEIALQAFHEDKSIIEAQQRVMEVEPNRPPLPVPADRGPMLFQRIMRDLAAAEAAPG